MQRRNNNNRQKRRNRRGNNALSLPMYQSIPMRYVEQAPAVHSLDAWVDLSSGLLGINGLSTSIQYNFFKNFNDIALFYKYFSVLSYKFDFSMTTRPETLEVFDGGAVAVVPVNYIIETVNTTVPSNLAAVQAITGSIQVMPGAPNRSKWVKVTAPNLLNY